MRAPDARRFHVLKALAEGLGAIPRVWTHAWGAMIFVTGAAAGLAATPDEPAARLVLGACLALGGLMAWGAANRVAQFGAEAPAHGLGPAGLQLGRREAAMVAAGLLNLIFLTMIGAVLALVALAIAGASELNAEALRSGDWASAGPAWRLALVGGVLAGSVWILILLIVRLSLFSQASVGRGRAVSLNTLGIASGSFWRLLVLNAVVFGPLSGGLILAKGGGALGTAVAAALAALWLPFAAGALSAAYRRL